LTSLLRSKRRVELLGLAPVELTGGGLEREILF
jgi:hypothetical protein